MRGINRSTAGLKAQQITARDEEGEGLNEISGRMDKERNQSGGRSGVGSTARWMRVKERRR